MADLKEFILQAYDLLHKGRVEEAHEVLHKALGVDNDAPSDHKPIGHRSGFDHAFRTACRKNGVRAMCVLIDSVDQAKGTRLLSGGDADLCEFVDRAVRSSNG